MTTSSVLPPFLKNGAFNFDQQLDQWYVGYVLQKLYHWIHIWKSFQWLKFVTDNPHIIGLIDGQS